MGDIFNDRTVNMLSKFHCSFRPARGAYPPAFARKRDKERVFASITVYPSSPVSEDTAIKVFVEGLQYLIS
jgi:hypothetical protein